MLLDVQVIFIGKPEPCAVVCVEDFGHPSKSIQRELAVGQFFEFLSLAKVQPVKFQFIKSNKVFLKSFPVIQELNKA